MATRFEVGARLAEGREAVAHTQTYVVACRQRGYRHPDLTGYDGQVTDWYDGEDGLDLRLLDDDCAGLFSAVRDIEEALRMQRVGLDELAGAWRGSGADGAAGFLLRHCDAGDALAGGLRAAARACEVLRDELWWRVDGKVTTAMSVDERVGARRAEWLAAVHAQDAEVIDGQIMPYVDNEIRSEWLDGMRACRAGVSAAYQSATAEAAPPSGVAFPIPGELGPRWQPDEPAAPLPAAPVVPVAVSPPPVEAAAPAAAVTPGPVADPPVDPVGWPADTGLPGFGLPDTGLPAGMGGLSGAIPRLADALSGLLGPPGEGLDETFEDPPVEESDDDPAEDIPEPAEQAADAEPDDTEPDDTAPDDAEPDDAEPDDAEPTVAAEEAGEAPVEVAAQAEPSSEQPVGPEETPCEIAADSLPQVGR